MFKPPPNSIVSLQAVALLLLLDRTHFGRMLRRGWEGVKKEKDSEENEEWRMLNGRRAAVRRRPVEF